MMEVEETSAAVFEAVDGERSVAEIAELTKMSSLVAEQLLQSLREVGAVF